jgi:hypothetical protein
MTRPPDDFRPDEDPEPDAPMTPGEQAHAASLARRLDDWLAGAPMPPALHADERVLLDTAAMLHEAHAADAAATHATLDPGLRRAIVEAALADAAPAATSAGASVRPRRRATGATPARGSRLRHALPWAVAMTAAAAALLFALRRPTIAPTGPRRDGEGTATTTPLEQRSRTADPLIGRIARHDAAHASARLDALFADRLAGYRAVTLGRGDRR